MSIPFGDQIAGGRVDKSADQSVYLQLADVLRSDIQAGRYEAGQWLPSERQLQKEHGIARGTVREALNRLKAEGLITVEHGRGAFVRSEPERLIVGLYPAGLGMPASAISAIREAGQDVSVRPLGTDGDGRGEGLLQTGVIVFADGVPLGTWRAVVDIDEDVWPAGLDAGVHVVFPPAKDAGHRSETRVRTVQPDDRRLLQLPAGAIVIEVEATYDSTVGHVFHRSTFVAERILLVHE